MELTHTLEVKPNLFIRSFIRFYDLSRKDPELNTCKLFWGTLGMVIIPIIVIAAAPIWIPCAGLIWCVERIKWRNKQRHIAAREAYDSLSWEERDAIEKAKNAPKTRAEWLDKLSAAGSAFWFKVQTPVTWFFRVLIAAVALFGFASLGYFLVTAIPGFPWGDILSLAWKIVLAVLLGVILGSGLFYLSTKWRESHPVQPKGPKEPKKPSVIKAVFASIHDHTCANVKIASVDE